MKHVETGSPDPISIRMASPADLELIRSLAVEIWPGTYRHILSDEQIRYMMGLFYGAESLRRQMTEQGHRFLLPEDDGRPVGFASYGEAADKGIFRLHKIYVLPSMQGRGLGKKIVDHIIGAIKPLGASALQLNVNRYNPARQFYEKLGFVVIREEDIDIGKNFFMNDFVMEKKI